MPTITGTAGPDDLIGTDEDDIIDLRGGADRVDARGGNDVIRNVNGAMEVLGGAGDDTVYVTGGYERLDGGAGVDTFDMSAIFYQPNVRFPGDVSTPTLRGVTGSTDSFGFGTGSYQGTGSARVIGFERIIGAAASSMRYDFAGLTNITYLQAGSLADLILVGSVGAEVRAGGGSDEIYSYAQGQQVFGEGGNDLFQIGTPGLYTVPTLFDGGEGIDRIRATINTSMNLTMGDGTIMGATYRSIEGLSLSVGTSSAVTLNVTGTAGADSIIIGGGANTTGEIHGGAGNDSISVGASAITVYGDDGDDNLSADTAALFGGAGNDVLTGRGALSGGAGDDRLVVTGFANGVAYDGGDGVDTIVLNANSYNVSLAAGTIDVVGSSVRASITGVERLLMGGGNDTVVLAGGDEYVEGGAGSDTIRGGAGADVINGDSGVDFLYGEAGNDFLLGGTEGDLLSGGDGNDTLDGGDGSDNIDGGAGTDVAIFAYARSEAVITYEPGRVIVQRNSGPIDTLTGIETLRFTDGYYEVVNGQVSAQPRGLIDGTAAADRLTGTAGLDTLRGGAGSDVLRGNGGADFIDGGAGIDTSRYNGVLGTYSTVSTSRVAGGGEGGTDELTGIEVLQFLDGRLSFDTSAATTVVYRLYDAALDRSPDAFGLADYARAIQEGRATVQQILEVFAASAEFQARYGSLTNEQFVAEMYRFSLNREPDGGANTYVTALNNGTATRAQVLGVFSESSEHQQLINAVITSRGLFVQDEQTASVARLYDSVFNRLPDLGGLTAYRDALDNGYTLKDIAAVLVASPEFQTRFGSLTDQQFVEQIYRFVLDREGDSAGIQSYVTALNNGASRTDVVLVLSESQEHRYGYQATYDGQIRQLGVNGYDPNGSGVGRSPLEDADKHHDAFVIPAIHDDAPVATPPSFAHDCVALSGHDGRMLVAQVDEMADATDPVFWTEDIRADAFTSHHSDWM